LTEEKFRSFGIKYGPAKKLYDLVMDLTPPIQGVAVGGNTVDSMEYSLVELFPNSPIVYPEVT
jgi:hypothetical protein